MHTRKSRTDELKKSIDVLTQDITNKIEKDELDDAIALFSVRLHQISELIAVSPADAEKKILRHYLTSILQRDQNIMLTVRKKQEQVKKNLSNIVQIKQYYTI